MKTLEMIRRVDNIVCEEWQRAVRTYGFIPGTPTEAVVHRILRRVRELRIAYIDLCCYDEREI